MRDIVIIIIWTWFAIIGNLGSVQAAVNVTDFFRHTHRGNDDAGAAPKPKNSLAFGLESLEHSPFYNEASAKFLVNGSAIPLVDWDTGESYAGNLPIGDDPEESLFFWFWPSTGPIASKQVVIWLNGGPGCSSLVGLLQEHGPILWQQGTPKPIKNPWSWHRLAHIVYIDQPIGTGFSQGSPTVTTQEEVAQQFAGFWANFVSTFNLHSADIYLAGESYAGRYCPFIADHFIKLNDPGSFGVKGMLLYSPLIGDFVVQGIVSLGYEREYWADVIPLNDSTVNKIRELSDSCGFNQYVDNYLKFPPNGNQPLQVPNTANLTCTGIQDLLFDSSRLVNPDGSFYQISQMSPHRFDPLNTLPNAITISQEPYFNRSDVKQALHAPNTTWLSCVPGVFAGGLDLSDNPITSVLPNVIEKTQNVIISHGMNDMLFTANGTLLAIQNMTWGQRQGFTGPPMLPIFVPYHIAKPTVLPPRSLDDDFDLLDSGAGVMGTTKTERGLTFNLAMLAGHTTPAYQPALAYRQLEVLLGRVESMNSTYPFVVSANPGDITGAVPQPDPATFGRGLGPKLRTDSHTYMFGPKPVGFVV